MIGLATLIALATPARAAVPTPPPAAYRQLVKSVPLEGSFKILMPGRRRPVRIAYRIAGWGKGRDPEPILMSRDSGQFFDWNFTTEGSSLKVEGDEEESLPLTCVHVRGQDNRASRTRNPLFPEVLLRVFLVANDAACVGPLNLNVELGGRRELWDTYLYFEVHDPQTMLPLEVKLRYARNEYHALLDRAGGGSR